MWEIEEEETLSQPSQSTFSEVCVHVLIAPLQKQVDDDLLVLKRHPDWQLIAQPCPIKSLAKMSQNMLGMEVEVSNENCN